MNDDPDDLAAAASTYTCDAGGCSAERAALVNTDDHGWLAMCARHAIEELSKP